MTIRIVMFGDIVGKPGRQAVAQLLPSIRERYKPDLVLANAENAASGSGLLPEHYHKLKAAGIDGITLGDHAFRKFQVIEVLESQPDLIRPANLPVGARGKGWMRLDLPKTSAAPGRHLYVITVLGRIFINLPADDPFAAVDKLLAQIPEKRPMVIVEIHAEATSEKAAVAWQFDGRVSAVLGTHTHVATADARVLPSGTGFMTDLGMCGPFESILGRDIDRVLTFMTTAMPTTFDVAEKDPRVNGVYLEINPEDGKCRKIERFEFLADDRKPPFTA